MATKTKRKGGKTGRLASYLRGEGALAGEFFSTGNLTGALVELRDYKDIDEDEIAAGVKRMLRGHHGFFAEHNLVKRALDIRRPAEPLLFALMSARNERARREWRRRR